MAVSFLTRLQQTINTALSPDPQVSATGPVPGSPSTPTSALPKSVCSQETPTKFTGVGTATITSVEADGTTSALTPHTAARGPLLGPVVVERERGRSPTTPSHLDARLPIEEQDIFSPSDRTITQSQPQVQTLTHLPPGSVVVDPSRGTDSTPSTATVRRYERSTERGEGEEEVLRDEEGGMKRRRKKRGVNETLVIVRPPPTSGPKKLMNLQIQLVLDVDRDKRKGKSRSTSVSSTATGSESIALPLDLPSPSILNNPIGGLRRPEMPSRLSTPAPSPPSTPGLGPVPGDSPTGRKTHITIAEPRSASRPGSIVRNVSGNDHKEVLKSAASDHEGVGQSTTPSSSDSEKRQKRRDRRLSRASSVVSQASVTSNVSAVSGISGVSGLSESTSGGSVRTNKRGKRIVPMYNLNVHNVMTTSVTDAGTDEKVAKFLKRAVDIHSVGSLEPAEIWHPYALDNRLPHLTPHQSRSDAGSPEHEDKVWGFNSTSSAAGPSSTNKRASLEAPAGLMARLEQEDRTAGPTSGKTKQFFGRLFKKKDAASESGSRDAAAGSGLISPARSSFVASSAERLLSPLSPASTRAFHASEARNSIVSTHSVVPNQQYASHTFGSYPMVSTAPDASLGEGSLHRPMGYTFTVKKWAAGKGGQETMIAPPSWAARFASTDKPVVGASPEGSEVVFEWSRGKGKSGRLSRTDGSGTRSASHGTIPMPVRSSSVASTNFGETLEVPSAESSRPTSMISMSDDHHTSLPLGPLQAQQQTARRSVLERARSEDRMTTSRSSSPAPSVRTPTRLSNHDDGEESDPEDSETPWVCRVYVPGRREDDNTARPDEKKSKNRRRDGPDGEGIIVATLYPAPHHPRVIAQVKVSTDYTPVATGIFRAASRSQSNTDSTTTTSIKGDEIMLSEENVKDVVGVTAMWLVVREDFGGLAKKKKAVEGRR